MVSRKLKIGIIQQSPDMGGAETYMLSLMREFKKNGCSIYFASNNGKFFRDGRERATYSKKIPYVLDIIGNYKGFIKSIILLPPATFFYVKLLRDFKRRNVNILLMSGFSEKMLVTFLALFIDIPVVWIEYSRLRIIFKRNFGFPKLLYLTLQNVSKKIIVPVKFTKSGLIEEGVKAHKIEVIPLGVKIPLKKNKLPNKKFIIGNVSRLTREKGQQILINAMPEIIESIPDAQLILIGDGPDKNYFNNLIKKLNLKTEIDMTGYVKNLNEYYRRMDVFVFPTVWNLEGFGLVVVEAMANKVPVVASDSYPVKEVVGESGLLFKTASSKGLAKKIIQLYENRLLRKEIGEKGYKKVKDIYDIEKNSRKLLDIIEKLAK